MSRMSEWLPNDHVHESSPLKDGGWSTSVVAALLFDKLSGRLLC